MSGQVKNQHYIPQMYLNRFSANERRINVWKLEDNVILKRQITRNYAAKRYYYDMTPTEIKSVINELISVCSDRGDNSLLDEQLIEKALGHSESAAQRVFFEIEKDISALYKRENQMVLAIFLHELTYRTEWFRNQMDSIYTGTLDAFKELNINPDEVEDFGKDGKIIQAYQLLGIIPLLQTCNMLFNKYNWFIGKRHGQMCFIISDNPCEGIFLGFNDICFPISGNLAIIFRIKGDDMPLISEELPSGDVICLSDRSILTYNRLQLSYANRFLFGDYNSMEVLRKITAPSSINRENNICRSAR